MIDSEHVRKMSDENGLEIPEADFAVLAADLSRQLQQIRSLDELDLHGVVVGQGFDVRWDR